MQKTKVYYSVQNGLDGVAYLKYFLTQDEADKDQEDMDDGWGESCTGMIETYVGSNVHKEAMEPEEWC